MMKNLNKILGMMAVIVSIGSSGPVLADAYQVKFDASQFKLDLILAKRGDPDAQYYVANAYEEGRGTQKDLKQAFEWYGKAAQQNQNGAQYKLGLFYENGLGVKQNIKMAMEWYKRAAKNSSSLVKDRLNNVAFVHREEAMKDCVASLKADQEKTERERKLAEAHSKSEAARKQQRLAAAQPKIVSMVSMSKPVEARRTNIPDISDVVLNNKWNYESEPADYLPSSTTHCLRSSGSEIVCFSDEKQRVINSMRVTYTTKATLTGFKPDGTFQIKYNYNATQMDKAANRGVSVDPRGLKLEQGWQEPQLAMNCRTTDRVNLYCARGTVNLHYRH